MAQYLSYDEYLTRGGALEETAFEAAEQRARARVDAMTYGRVRRMAAVPEAVKAAMMSAIEAGAACGAGAVASSSPLAAFETDGYSERYQGAGERSEAVEKALKRELAALLGGETDDEGTPLTYAGGLVT